MLTWMGVHMCIFTYLFVRVFKFIFFKISYDKWKKIYGNEEELLHPVVEASSVTPSLYQDATPPSKVGNQTKNQPKQNQTHKQELILSPHAHTTKSNSTRHACVVIYIQIN